MGGPMLDPSKGKGKDGKKGGKGKSARPLDKTGDNVTAAMSVFLALLFIGIVLGTLEKGWHYKMTHVWNFYIGIYSLEVNMDTLGGLALKSLAMGADMAKGKGSGKKSDYLGGLVSAFSRGTHTIQHIRDQMCNAQLFTGGMLGDMCVIWNKMQYSSWGMLVAIGLNVLLLCLAAGFCSLETTRCTRKFTYICYCLSISIMLGSLTGYFLLTYELDTWLTDKNLAVSLGVTFDKGFYAVVFLTLMECVPPAVLMCCGTKMPTIEEELISDGKIEDPNAKGKGKGKDPFGKGGSFGGKDSFGKGDGKGDPMMMGKGDPYGGGGGDPYGKGGPPPGGDPMMGKGDPYGGGGADPYGKGDPMMGKGDPYGGGGGDPYGNGGPPPGGVQGWGGPPPPPPPGGGWNDGKGFGK